MAIIRIYTGPDGKSHFEDVEPRFQPCGSRAAAVRRSDVRQHMEAEANEL